ncbi:MAG TPA: lysophospholipid acyltransferase family protein [Caulobacterales bacterium]|nr:lysophospholipid acyltransferase family protein [Caulobacterales bacterium]
MAKPKPINFLYRLEALGWFAFTGGMGALKLEDASALGANIVPLVAPLVSANKTALRNLRMCYPNESETWRREVAKAMWHEIGRMAGEFPHMGEFVERLHKGEIEFEGREIIEATKGKGAVFIGGHFTNWEVISLCLAQVAPDCYFTYRPANNPIIDKDIIETRRKFGLELQAAKGTEGGMGLLRALAKKKGVALMNDQKYNMGVNVPLFGHDCMTADGPTRLALRFRVPLIPLSGRRTTGVRFKVRVHEPIQLDYDAPLDTEVLAGVKRVNDFMEARIREAPEQWFWVHRRWPKEAWWKAGVA